MLVALHLGLDVPAGALVAFLSRRRSCSSPRGWTGARIAPLLLAFFSGRVVSYSLYVGAAETAGAKLGDSLLDGLRSPAGIAVQLAMLAMLAVLLKVDWRRVLARHHSAPGATRQARS